MRVRVELKVMSVNGVLQIPEMPIYKYMVRQFFYVIFINLEKRYSVYQRKFLFEKILVQIMIRIFFSQLFNESNFSNNV